MYIFKTTKLRANQYARYVDEQGTQYHQVPMELLEEIPDPMRGDDEYNYNQEINEPPYLIVMPKSQEQLDQQRKSKALAELTALEQANLMPRVTREFLIAATLMQAASLGLTEVQLIDPLDPAYSPGFKKMWDFNEQTKVLRAKL